MNRIVGRLKGVDYRYLALVTGITLAAGMIFYRKWIFAFAAVPLYPATKTRYDAWVEDRRRKEMRNQFRDMLYSFSASFSSGRHMTEAMEEAVDSLRSIYGEGSLLSDRLEYMLRRIRDTGDSDIIVWEEFAFHSGVAEIEEFTQVFRACRDTGGDLIRAADRAASVITDKIDIENDIRTMSAQKKLEGKLITAIPVILLVFLSIVSPQYIAPLYETMAGRIVMTMVLAVMAIAYRMIERITSIEV